MLIFFFLLLLLLTEPCPPDQASLVPVDSPPNFPTSGTRVSLTWGTPPGEYEGFRISYVDPDGDPDEKVEAGVVDRDTRMFTVVGLYVNQQYTFCVETVVDIEDSPLLTASDPVTVQASTSM